MIERHNANLLVVDDDHVFCKIIESVASRIGIEASSVASLAAAIDQVRLTSFDFVTVDLSLGDDTGIELLRIIGKLERQPHVIVISGCDKRILKSIIRMAREAGIRWVDAHEKPIDTARLRDILMSSVAADDLQNPPVSKGQAVTSARLGEAIEAGEIYATYQPKMDLELRRTVGCEVLARWECPTSGSIPPDRFIPVAEQTGQIHLLTLQMLREALESLKEIFEQDPAFVMGINVSAGLLSIDAFPAEIEAILNKAGVPARSLTLEITETVAMADVSPVLENLLQLRLKGFGISIDDFGTGYSSLSLLANVPFTELKLDKSFVTRFLHDEDLKQIVLGAIVLGHQLGMKVVAEGIEDFETLTALAAAGCDEGQGYVISRALGKDDFLRWYGQRADRRASVA